MRYEIHTKADLVCYEIHTQCHVDLMRYDLNLMRYEIYVQNKEGLG